uniref:inactive peptidyl-prolyl cis-trans isomerase FKBP6 n=1 Tax=Euleptes europaea TaxID=460621 RepID=UPI0025418C68|nr:inactive peptidyl-prolyl cis-trans isomerase FKBP6 [Euleptes europaea]
MEVGEGWRGSGREKRNGAYPQAGNDEAVSPYQRLSERMQDITGDGGVLKEVIHAGLGEVVPPDASVLVKFSGYLEHMDQPFDTNCFKRNLRLMKVGEDITLRGMAVGLLTMKRGEMARFLFKPDYAFGMAGCPPLIPPKATVLFEIELLDFLDTAKSDEFFELAPEQQKRFPLEKVLKVAETEREFGNYLFRQKHFMDARERYKRASSVLHRVAAKEDEQVKVDSAKLLVLLNLSITYLKLQHPARALSYGERALELDQKNAKALFRCGQACLSLAEYERARDFLIRAQKEQPFNHDINNELKKLASCYREFKDKEKEMCTRMFSSLSAGEELKVGAQRTGIQKRILTGGLDKLDVLEHGKSDLQSTAWEEQELQEYGASYYPKESTEMIQRCPESVVSIAGHGQSASCSKIRTMMKLAGRKI